jgi:hypothetical protein
MTSLTKQYIELSDLAAVVISCANCKAALTLPLMGANRMNLPETCPNCQHTWSVLSSSEVSKAQRLAGFFQAFHQLRLSLDAKNALERGFALGLEIPLPVLISDATSR